MLLRKRVPSLSVWLLCLVRLWMPDCPSVWLCLHVVFCCCAARWQLFVWLTPVFNYFTTILNLSKKLFRPFFTHPVWVLKWCIIKIRNDVLARKTDLKILGHFGSIDH